MELLALISLGHTQNNLRRYEEAGKSWSSALQVGRKFFDWSSGDPQSLTEMTAWLSVFPDLVNTRKPVSTAGHIWTDWQLYQTLDDNLSAGQSLSDQVENALAGPQTEKKKTILNESTMTPKVSRFVDRNILSLVNSNADTLWNLKDDHQSEGLNRQLFEGRKKVYGPYHQRTLRALLYVATSVENQGRADDAEFLYLELLAGRKKEAPIDCCEILSTVLSLVRVMRTLNKSMDAKEYLQEAVEYGSTRLARTDGPHPQASDILRALGYMLFDLERYDEATCLLQQAKELGNDDIHPKKYEAIVSAEYLGLGLYHMKRYEEAAKFQLGLVERYADLFGPDSAETSHAMCRLGETLFKQGSYSKLEKCFRQVLVLERS